MKNILKIIIPILFLSVGCKAQIVNIEDDNGLDQNGKYFKDLNNILGPFAGTYVYTNGNVSFKVILKKMEHSSMGDVYYEDLLIGEYEYKVNNTIVVSTLNKLDINYDCGGNYSIDGNNILRGGSRACRTCPSTDLFVNGGLTDGNSKNTAEVFIKRITVNGLPAIEFSVKWRMRSVNKSLSESQIIANGDGPASFPGIDYIMIKE